ncbi:MAG: hypothetical protein H6747_12230 [Deltaproteobacteria bacterium]|nr:hypothetical protein [Deltaproteobacteria bacterium]
MHPNARRDGIVARPLDGDLVLLGQDHDVHRLDAVTGWVWQHADGSKSPAALLTGLRAEVHADADLELVFEALDRLADAGLLQERVAPPAGVTRRVTMQRLAGASALAALTAILARSPAADAAAGGGGQCADDKAIIEEIAWLEATEAAVAELLEDWVEEADAKDDADEYYVAALDAREVTRKKAAAELGDDLEEATDDLAACTLAAKKGIAHSEAKRKAQAKTLLKKRIGHAQERDQKATVRLKKRVESSLRHESKAKHHIKKAAIHKSESAGGDTGAGTTEELLAASRKREQATKAHHEQNHKAAYKQSEEGVKLAEASTESRIKSSETQYLHHEQREKRKAQWLKQTTEEQAAKGVAGSDYVLEQAQKEAMLAEQEAIEARKAEQKAKDSEKQQAAEKKAKSVEQEKATEQKIKVEQKEKAVEQKAKQEYAASEETEKAAAKKQEQTVKAKEASLEQSKKAL